LAESFTITIQLVNMNRKSILAAALSLCLVTAAIAQENRISYSLSSNNGHSSVSITDDNLNFKLSYTGDISFTDDEKNFKSFPSDGFLRYQKNGTILIVTLDAAGKIAYEINGGDKKTVLNDNEKDVVASAIRLMIEYGIGAKERVARIYQGGGTKAVMEEVRNMKTDYVRGQYLQFLLATNNLSPADMTEIAEDAQTLISSDYEKGRLLQAFSSKYLGNEGTARAFLGAVKSIHSDYEKAMAVKTILHQQLTDQEFTAVIEITTTISSDYEKGGVLSGVIDANTISESRFAEVIHAAAAIAGDYEKGQVLKKVFATGVTIPEAAFGETLDAVGTISGDYEKAGVLKKMAGSTIKSEADWISLIRATAKINGDYEKGETLRFIAEKMPGSETEKEAYNKAARTIAGDFEYGKTIRALK